MSPSTARRFLARWGGYLIFVIVFAVACGLLSWWQWARRAEAVEKIELVEANYDLAPVPVSELLPGLESWSPDAEWRPVSLVGEYLADEQLLVRNRPYQGRPGFEVIVPFQTADGRVLLVDRGWVPTGTTADVPDEVPAPPGGEVEVVARLKPPEPQIPGRSAPEGQLATIDPVAAAEQVPGELYTGAYALLAEETPAVGDLPLPALRPEADEGPHLSYALQWIAFGILAFIGLGWAVRHDRIVARAQADLDAGIAPPPPRRRRSGPTDAEAEDALLDAQRSPRLRPVR